MQTLSLRPTTVGRRPAIPYAAIGATHTRQPPTITEGCPCCGATMNAVKPFVAMTMNSLVYKNKAVRLGPVEALIAQKLAQRMPATVLHDSLISYVWGNEEPENVRVCVNVHLYYLRAKLRPLGVDIVNIHSVGYRMVML